MLKINLTQNIQMTQSHYLKLTLEYVKSKNVNKDKF